MQFSVCVLSKKPCYVAQHQITELSRALLYFLVVDRSLILNAYP